MKFTFIKLCSYLKPLLNLKHILEKLMFSKY